MDLIDKLEPIIILISIIIGLTLSNVTLIAQNTDYLINIFLCLMLYAVFLEIPLKNLKDSFKNVKFTTTSLIINFIWTPLLGYTLAQIFLKGNIDLIIGFFMLIITPCTDWYLIFTKIAKGDLKLSLSILPINLILQIILLPIYLILFFSQANTLDYTQIIYSLTIVIVIPLLLAQLTKIIFKQKLDKLTRIMSRTQILFLSLAVFSIFASQGELLFSNINSLVVIFIPLILFFTINIILDWTIYKKSEFTYSEYASLTMTTLARNSPLALAIAINSFPGHELISIALVIGPLIELPALYITSKLLLFVKKHWNRIYLQKFNYKIF